jgi:hypothetical protein
MPKAASEKCRLCSKLLIAQVLDHHGPSVTNCWEGEPCHKRRSYYRDRYNANKRQQYRGVAVSAEVDDGKGTVLTVVPAVAPAAGLHLYRAQVDDPLHADSWCEAIGAELWLGQSKVAQIETVHTMELMPAQIKVFLKEILTAFSGQVTGGGVTQFEVQKELSPECCPLRPCPLHD